MRREWIEIHLFAPNHHQKQSPSMRREWIEIVSVLPTTIVFESPSMRREWIEMHYRWDNNNQHMVSLHAEGVD